MAWVGRRWCWFDEMFVGYPFQLKAGVLGDEVSAKCTRQISEKTSIETFRDPNPSEAIAVYEADLYQKKYPLNKQAIVKIYMQVPTKHIREELSWDAHDYAHQAVEISENYITEREALEDLADCPFTPLIYDCIESKQTETFWVLGGYLDVIIMQKVPGETLRRAQVRLIDAAEAVWKEEQNRMIEGFKRACSGIWSRGIHNMDVRSDNAIWDSEGGRCYIIDFEDIWRGSSGNWENQGGMDREDPTRTLWKWGLLSDAEAGIDRSSHNP